MTGCFRTQYAILAAVIAAMSTAEVDEYFTDWRVMSPIGQAR
jgi:hypothetical protein